MKRALISVFDKTGIVEFAKSLNAMGVGNHFYRRDFKAAESRRDSGGGHFRPDEVPRVF